jgi:hypothetical protein
LGYTIKRHQVTRAAKEQKNQPTQYAERLRRQRKREYRLNYLIAPPESIRAEWQLLMAHKTNPFRERASPREIWRCKPIELIGHKLDWSELYAGQAVPAANAACNSANSAVRGKETAKVAALSVRNTQASSRPASVTSSAQFC